MKFLVCISQVPDTTTKISFTPDKKALNAQGVQFIINPYDEIALTRALELKEALGGTVTVINVGGASAEANIRKALAIGADDAIRINAEHTDALHHRICHHQHLLTLKDKVHRHQDLLQVPCWQLLP